MTMPPDICGYLLGRYLKSSNSFVVAPSEKPDDPAGLTSGRLTIVSWRGDSPRHDPLTDSGLVDVGRTSKGDLVFVRSHPHSGEPEEFSNVCLSFSLIGNESTEPPDPGPTFGDKAEGIERHIVSTPSESPRWSADTVVLGLRALRKHILVLATAALRNLPVNVGLREYLKERKSRRLIRYFVVASIALCLLVVLVLSMNTRRPDALSPDVVSPDASTQRTAIPEPKKEGPSPPALTQLVDEQDPVEFALKSLRAGASSLGFDSAQGDTVSGRILSKLGDIVLVEVTVRSGDHKTIATLALEKTATGWRTRDEFASVG